MTTRRASLYLRISVASDESDSLERQERDLRRLAEAEGLEVAQVRRDEGISGAATERPAFREWLADASEGRAEVLLAWRFDRISREGLGAVARILEVLKDSGARLLTHGDRMDSDSAAFRLTAAVLSEVAYAERESIRARVTSRQAADRRNGYWTKARPFGYLVQDGRLVQHPEEAPVVLDLVERFLAGESLRALASYLDAQGVPTPRATKGHKVRDGALWGMTSVRHLLVSPTLTGHYPTKASDGRTVAARDDHGDLVLVTDDPILSTGVHAAVLARLEARSVMGPRGRRPRGGRPPAHPLSGLLRCECGGSLVYDARNGSDRRPVFRCQRHSHSATACPGQFIRAEALEEALAYRVLRYVPALDPDSPEAEVLRVRYLRTAAPTDSAEREVAVQAVADAEAALADLEAARYERAEFPGARGAERYQRLFERLSGRLEAAEAVLAALPEPSSNDAALFDREVLREALEAEEHEPRRALYALVLDRVVVARGTAEDLDARLDPQWASAS
jgi:site-specific DNA recombinase